MPGGKSAKEKYVPLIQAAKMLNCSVRKVATLVRQNKLEGFTDPRPRTERGRPQLVVTKSSLESYAASHSIILREPDTEDQRGRARKLSEWLNESPALIARLRKARIIEIDGQATNGQVWVRFSSLFNRREILCCFWRQDTGHIFGARSFRIELEEAIARAHVFVRSHDDELDRIEIKRCFAAAVASVEREDQWLKEDRERKKALLLLKSRKGKP